MATEDTILTLGELPAGRLRLCTLCVQRAQTRRGLCLRCYQRARAAGSLSEHGTMRGRSCERAQEIRMDGLRRWAAMGKPPDVLRCCEGCRQPFLPTHPGKHYQRWCSTACHAHHNYLRRKEASS